MITAAPFVPRQYCKSKSDFKQGQTIVVLVIKQLMKVKKLNPWLQWPNKYSSKQLIMCRFNLCFATQFSYELRHSFFTSPKLSSWNNAKFHLKIFYPPYYKRVIWHYQDAVNDRMQQSISQFNWQNFSKHNGKFYSPWNQSFYWFKTSVDK